MNTILYNLFLLFYGFAIRIASLFKEKASHWLNGRKNIWQRLEASLPKNEERIWFHCSSVGEFEQARPLIEAIKLRSPDKKIFLTFFSPSGYEMRKNYEHADYVFYLPLDGKRTAKKFVDLVNPCLAVFVKYEFWYYYLTALKQKEVSTILISAAFRSSQPFFKWYGGFHKKMLHCFTHLFVHDEASAILLNGIGFKENVSVAGDTRYDRVMEIAQQAKSFPIIESFKGENKLLVAGSTWSGDEKILKEVLPTLPFNWKLVMAPHELNETHLQQMKNLFSEEAVFYSQFNDESKDKRALIVDNMGMLSSIYRYGEIAYVGGGFLKGGIHNTLEPAVFGLPVLFGPVYKKFVEAVELVENDFGFPIQNAEDCKKVLKKLIEVKLILLEKQKVLRKYMNAHTGAKDKMLEWLNKNDLI
jgi:3-deoxy-D-manno-octulosonic-acid transferase